MSAVTEGTKVYETAEDYAAFVDRLDADRVQAEDEFLFALKDGFVLVEYWLGEADRHPNKCKVWHPQDMGGPEQCAAHVSNRYRAGWTEVVIADPALMVQEAHELAITQTISAWNGEEYIRAMVMGKNTTDGLTTLRVTAYCGTPSWEWTTESDTPVYLD